MSYEAWDAQVAAAIAELRGTYEADIRAEPDTHRRGRFRLGWHDASVRHREYSEVTLANLTWHNLGFRLGKKFGARDEDLILRAYDHAVELLRGEATAAMPEGEPMGVPDVTAAGFIASTVEDRRAAKHHLMMERKARPAQECLQRDAWTCQVCGVRMRERYGLDHDLAEAHYIRPLARLAPQQRQVVQVADLVTLCPNCHRAVHRLNCRGGVLESLRGQLCGEWDVGAK